MCVPHFAQAGDDGVSLRIIFTSDTRGMLRRCGCSEGQMGGLSARTTFIKEHRLNGRTIVLDAGDSFFGEPVSDPAKAPFYRLKMQTMVKCMEAAGTDASTVGEYDLAGGLDMLEDVTDGADFPFLSANVKRDTIICWNRTPFEGSTILDAGGLRVGVIGVADSVFPYRDYPQSMSDVEVLDTIKSARCEISRIRDKSDIIVVLAHLNFITPEELEDGLTVGDDDGPGRGADVIIKGHSQRYLTEPELYGGSIIVVGYYRAKYIGVLDLSLDADKKLAGHDLSVYPLGEDIPLDPEVENVLDGYRAQLKERAFDFAKPDPSGAGRYVGTEACAGCHEVSYGEWLETRHSGAYDELTKTNDEYDPECLVCHTTGYGYESGYRADAPVETLKNVGCEMCHGRGEGHVVRMKGGMTDLPDIGKGPIKEETCRRCHDEENSTEFEFETYMKLGGDHTVLPH